MATRRALVTLSATAGALVLLANFHTSSASSILAGGDAAGVAATTSTTAAASASSTSVGTPETAAAPPPPTPPPTTQPRAASPTKTTTVDGPLIGTPYGDVQVRAVLRGNQLLDVEPLVLPNDRARSRRISELAAPLLRTEALRAQSANIDLLSGASYTSEGYAESLQGALDQARS